MPTALRSPEAKSSPLEPSGRYRMIAARRESLSRQMLHEEPMETYSRPSEPKASVRVQCPPVGRLGTMTVGWEAFIVAAS